FWILASWRGACLPPRPPPRHNVVQGVCRADPGPIITVTPLLSLRSKELKNMKSEESEPRVPADLRDVFAAAPIAKAQWNDLTPLARKDFIMWVDSAKQSETRRRRIESIPSRLASGKRRPCCFAIVPLNLHKALAAAPKAKTQWGKLTSLERRDFASW